MVRSLNFINRPLVLIAIVLAVTVWSVASAGQEAKLPVLFAPGLGVSGEFYEKTAPWIKAFTGRGYPLKIAHTLTRGSIQARAESLHSEIQRLIPEGRFHVVAHSTGGLDIRQVIHDFGLGDRVATVTSISTPHRGTAAASHALALDDKNGSLIPEDLRESLTNLTPEYMETVFNPAMQDDPRVRYFSVGCAIPTRFPAWFYTWNPLILWGHSVLQKNGDILNDGFVPLESAKWGEYLGTFGAEHFTETSAVPFGGKLAYPAIFERVIENLESTSAR